MNSPRQTPRTGSAASGSAHQTGTRARPRAPRRRTAVAGLAAGALALATLLSACGGDGGGGATTSGSGDTAGGSATVANGTPASGGTITYAHVQEVPCLDPASGGWVQQALIARQYLDSLVSLEPGGRLVPWLATSWSVSPDGLRYTLQLKRGVRFTDGSPFDADAVKANIAHWFDPRTGSGALTYFGGLFDARSTRVVDPYTVAITLNAPYSPLLTVLSQSYFGMQSPRALARGLADNCESPVGTGPFVVEKWNHGQDVTMVRNPGYNSAPENARHQGPAYVDGLVWKFLPDPTARFGALETGQVDAIYDVPTVDWDGARADFELQQVITPGAPVRLALNTIRPPFDELKVRQAFLYAGNARAAAESAFNGVVPWAGNPALSSSTPDYDAALADAYPLDLDSANRLLDEAGWTQRDSDGFRTKGGRRLTVRLVYGAGAIINQEGATLLQNLQQQVKEAGFDVVLEPKTQAEIFSGRYSTPDAYNAYPSYWTAPTPGVLLINYRQSTPDSPNPWNTSFFNDPQLDSTARAANATLDPARQRALYERAQRIVADNAVALGLYPQTTSLAIDRRLQGVWIEPSQGEPVFGDAHFAR
ncbi:ABC transporter substrate-binding protein [Conexibacter sp. CPCC 206217]|uniref:ABC transporter substrate-binding protein n=1 Tax=Conexibacter sp. CPCC 206217 TaxID=3064574 RepID=UPI0027268ED7|nr:ABC transporter substrate-binding protein [Conexibacter sp. CPCC 206217]MDO8212150.1 ABC transporter substrate-binding protein [Conexibacter sp. CPCC 206217]